MINQTSMAIRLRLATVLLALGSGAAWCNAGRAVEIVAHRGESIDAPENTLAALRLAWERGADAVELDIHLTRDQQAIVIHDRDTQRTTGANLVVKHSSLDQLRQLDAGSWKGQQWAGERLPTLEEVLDILPPQGRYFLEIKVGPEAVPVVAKAIQQSGKPSEQLVIISFNADTIAAAKRLLPHIEAYYLSGFERDPASGQWTPTLEQLIDRARAIGADGLDVSYKGPIDADFVHCVRSANLKLYVYTVNDLQEARRLADLGVDGITTDRAAWLRERLAPTANPPR